MPTAGGCLIFLHPLVSTRWLQCTGLISRAQYPGVISLYCEAVRQLCLRMLAQQLCAVTVAVNALAIETVALERLTIFCIAAGNASVIELNGLTLMMLALPSQEHARAGALLGLGHGQHGVHWRGGGPPHRGPLRR